MSPEQARGKTGRQARRHLGFGVVLYEMLERQETVRRRDRLRHPRRRAPPRDLLRRSAAATSADGSRLARPLPRTRPKNRLRDIGEARIALERAPTEPKDAETKPERPAARRGSLAGWTAAAALAILAAFLAWKSLSTPAMSRAPVTAFAVTLPEGVGIPRSDPPVLTLSRDGRTLVFAADDGRGQRLYRRSMGRVEITPIEGTEGADDPVISPDGKLVAFVAGQKLKTVPIAGGTPTVLCDSPADRGIAWSPDGRIFFSPSFDTGLMQIPAAGGTPAALTKPNLKRDERSHRWPDVLPDGKAVLFTVGEMGSPGNYDGSPIAAVDLATGREKILLKSGPDGALRPARSPRLPERDQALFRAFRSRDAVGSLGSRVRLRGSRRRGEQRRRVFLDGRRRHSELRAGQHARRRFANRPRLPLGIGDASAAPRSVVPLPAILPGWKADRLLGRIRTERLLSGHQRRRLDVRPLFEKSQPLTFEGHDVHPVWSPDESGSPTRRPADRCSASSASPPPETAPRSSSGDRATPES